MRYYKLGISGLLFTTLFSCQKLVEIPETDLIAGAVALQTVNNNEQALIGAYGGLSMSMNILANSTFTDEVKTAGEFYNAATTHEWQFSSTDVGIRDNFTAINPLYRMIDRVNRVLTALPNADSTRAGDNALRAKVRGEALFLRAYAHFELFRYYAGNYDPAGLAMPYIETSSLDPQGRINMGPYFEKLLADLTEAKGLLPNNLNDKNRANRIAANGFHARVALYMRDWANAETYATEFINALPLASMAQFPGIWTDANTSEVAMQIFHNTGVRLGSLFRGTSANAANIGTIVWQPTDKLWNSYDQDNDVRFDAYFLDEPILAGLGRPSKIVQKYAGTGYGTANENVNNSKLFRTGEMYLIRAEARAEQGRFTGANSAESDINALRAARIDGYVNETFGSQQEAIDEIIYERFKELAFEGHRFFDLKRRNLPVVRNPAEAPTPASATLPAGDHRFLLPIPMPELQANTAMVQNPGY